MAVLVGISDSIEGSKISLKTRQFFIQTPKMNKKLGAITHRFKLGIMSYATISDERNPKKAIVEDDSHLNEGDELRAQSISGFSTKPIKRPSVGKGSASHSASFIDIAGNAFAKIIVPRRESISQTALPDS